jgi:twitching motility protein PilT
MAVSLEIQWVATLGAEKGLFTFAQCANVVKVLAEGADGVAFSQKLIDAGVAHDLEALEGVLDEAMRRAAEGPPARNPFAGPSLTVASRAGAGGTEGAPTPRTGLPSFPFERVATMNDTELRDAVRGLLVSCARGAISDLHLSAGSRPFIRKNRELLTLADKPLTADDSLRLNTIMLSDGERQNFLQRRDLDYALAVDASNRYRVNLMVHKNGPAGAYRMVPAKVLTLEELGFGKHVDTIRKLLTYHNGLILVTGPVGAGKTTTLASLVDFLNTTREDHIITVEDPIEVVQPAKGCNVSQREVGSHTRTFFSALKGALREDPDIIVIGELRDLETIEMAISASETGHLVIGTMHTSDAATTLNRLLDVFPAAQQTQIRASVAESLRGIVCQRLLPAIDGGLQLACEIMVSNLAIQALIRENKGAGLRNTMETGVKEGMCLMDTVVFGLWQEQKISAAIALANISNRVLRQKIT